MCTHVHAQTLQHARQGRTLDQLSGLEPAMLISSVHTVVACYATALRVCTLVLFHLIGQLITRVLHVPCQVLWVKCSVRY